MSYSEVLLIRRLKKGDAQAFGEVYDRYIHKIYDFIYYKTHDKELAEDLASDTFTKVLEHIGTLDSAKGSVASFLYRVARNTVIDHYRTKKSHIPLDDVWNLEEKSDFSADIDARDQLDQVKKYLSTLSNEQRDIIIMRVWQEMSYKEIAQILDKSEASCKMAFCRAIKQVREHVPFAVFILLVLHL